MSHARDGSSEVRTADLRDRHAELQEMISQGRSFSGHERNRCFLNIAGDSARNRRFANVSATSGIDFADDGRSIALVDWDQDGDVDLWISNRTSPQLRFLRNNMPRNDRFLLLRLVGNGTTCNRDAIGARVEVHHADAKLPPQIKALRAGEGFLAQSSKWLHFGLGSGLGGSPKIKQVTVNWPDGSVDSYDALVAGRRYRIVQGEKTPAEEKVTRSVALEPSDLAPQAPSQRARIVLVAPFPVPRVSYQDFDGLDVPLPLGQGKPILLTLWASWCRPCLKELGEFADQHEQLRAAGLEVFALSVDGLGDVKSDPAAARRVVERLKLPFDVGLATKGLVDDLQYLHNLVIQLHRPMPVPSSFLIDGQGKLVAIYKGPVRIDDLLADVRHVDDSREQRFARAALLPGRAIRHENVSRKTALSVARILLQLAETAKRSKRVDEAANYHAEVLKLNPESAESHRHLGDWASQRGNVTVAIGHYEAALRISPKLGPAHRSLGSLKERQGKIAEAVKHYEAALQSNSRDTATMNNLAWIMATHRDAALRDGERAVRLARKMCDDGNTNRPELLDTLAAAYAEIGDYAQAVSTAEKALDRALGDSQGALARQIRQHLRTYKSGRPFRAP